MGSDATQPRSDSIIQYILRWRLELEADESYSLTRI